MEMYVGAVQVGERALIIDDLIATRSTLCAAIKLLGKVNQSLEEKILPIGAGITYTLGEECTHVAKKSLFLKHDLSFVQKRISALKFLVVIHIFYRLQWKELL